MPFGSRKSSSGLQGLEKTGKLSAMSRNVVTRLFTLVTFVAAAFSVFSSLGMNIRLQGAYLAILMINVVLLKVLSFKTASVPDKKRSVLRIFNGVTRILVYCCWVLAFTLLASFIRAYWQDVQGLLPQPFPLNAMEGRETVKAWLLAHGRNLYPSLETHPYLITIYPPVYHAVTAAAALFSGWNIGAGRWVSLVSFMCLAPLAGVFGYRLTGSRVAAFLVFAVLLLDPVLGEWSLHARPDMLAWLLALAGSVCFWGSCNASQRRHSTRLALVSGVVLCLALFTKQQTLPYFLGCVVWAVGRGREGWRSALLMCLSCFALGTLLIGALETWSGGYFLRDIVFYPKLMGALVSISTYENLMVRLGQAWEQFRTLWLLFGLYLAWALWKRRWDLPMVLTVVNAAFMVKLLASWGADINYAFGTVISASLCMGLLAGALAATRPYGQGLAFALLFLCVHVPAGHSKNASADTSFLRGLDGTLLVNTEGGHLFLGDQPRRSVVFFDGIETQLFEQTGLWKSEGSDLVQDIRNRSFDHLVFYGGFLPQSVLDAAAVSYDVKATEDHYTVLSPSKAFLVASADSSGKGWSNGNGAVLSVDTATLHQETEGLAPLDRTRPGIMRFMLKTDSNASRVEAVLDVRLDPKDPGSSARISLLGEEGRPLASSLVAEKGLRNVTLNGKPSGNTLELLVELSGNAWISPRHSVLAVLKAFE